MLAPGLLPGLSRGPHEAEVNTTPPQLDSGPASREFRNNYRPLSFSASNFEISSNLAIFFEPTSQNWRSLWRDRGHLVPAAPVPES